MDAGPRSSPVALIVDDDHALLDILSRFLRRRGFVVHTACTPIGAGTIVTEEAPDIVVLDVMMPALDGGSIAGLLRQRGEAVPIVFYTSMPEEDARALTQRISSSVIVSKNDGPKALVTAIERLLAAGPADPAR